MLLVLPPYFKTNSIGIISLTKVAARDAGFACAAWMLLYGIFGKFGALFTSIPLPVLGGCSTFLFANIAVSGIKVMTTHGIDRRSRFIMAIAGSFGIGTITVPQWFTSGEFSGKQSEKSKVSLVCYTSNNTLYANQPYYYCRQLL